MEMTHPDVMTQYQQFIHMSRYSRWLEDKARRETWFETVSRYIEFFSNRIQQNHPKAYEKFIEEGIFKKIEDAIINLDVMPSMRSLMTAGKALERDEVAGYNCSFIAVDDVRAFDEILYILMCGTGVGFSVERQFVSKLPMVPDELVRTETVINVRDSKVGWASSFRELISLLYAGRIPKWDVSKVRPAGAKLKTFGGRASGPGPLVDLFEFTIAIFKKAAGRRLTSVEVHDIVCKVADSVVVGGVRRSALISLSNLSDDRMRNAKNGAWWEENNQRQLANNSVAYTEKPDFEIFMKEWFTLYESRSGERGIFNRVSAMNKAANGGRRKSEGHEFGTNPCGEIILRSMGLCNLSEIVIRPEDTEDTLHKKVELATIVGTIQSTLTNFRYVRKAWKNNAEEERLLGVSMTGIMDNPLTWKDKKALKTLLSSLRETAVATNAKWAELFGINQSVAITTVKPSGTVSQLVNCSSGIHPGYAPYYIRRVRGDKKDPLTQYLRDIGIPYEDDVSKPETGCVFSFPMKSAKGSVDRNHIQAMEQLELYRIYRDHWCEHNPSITVYYKNNGEFFNIGGWVYDNFDSIGGMAFLPHSEHQYKQAPYEEISREAYNKMVSSMPTIDWSWLPNYEKEDSTTGTRDLACMSGACEIL